MDLGRCWSIESRVLLEICEFALTIPANIPRHHPAAVEVLHREETVSLHCQNHPVCTFV